MFRDLDCGGSAPSPYTRRRFAGTANPVQEQLEDDSQFPLTTHTQYRPQPSLQSWFRRTGLAVPDARRGGDFRRPSYVAPRRLGGAYLSGFARSVASQWALPISSVLPRAHSNLLTMPTASRQQQQQQTGVIRRRRQKAGDVETRVGGRDGHWAPSTQDHFGYRAIWAGRSIDRSSNRDRVFFILRRASSPGQLFVSHGRYGSYATAPALTRKTADQI